MRILHYTVGFSPYRSGGLTRYAKDLMVSQRRFGYDVAAFYPSGSNLLHIELIHHFDREGNLMYSVVFSLSSPPFFKKRCILI